MEAPTRIELVHKGFADLSLTTWARRRRTTEKITIKRASGRRDSNSRHLAWEANALPLNYSRTVVIIVLQHVFVKRVT